MITRRPIKGVPLLDEVRQNPITLADELMRALECHARGDRDDFTPEHAWYLLTLLREQYEGKKPAALKSRRGPGDHKHRGREEHGLKVSAVAYVLRAENKDKHARKELERLEASIEAAKGQLREAEEREAVEDLASRNEKIAALGAEAEQLAASLHENLPATARKEVCAWFGVEDRTLLYWRRSEDLKQKASEIVQKRTGTRLALLARKDGERYRHLRAEKKP